MYCAKYVGLLRVAFFDKKMNEVLVAQAVEMRAAGFTGSTTAAEWGSQSLCFCRAVGSFEGFCYYVI